MMNGNTEDGASSFSNLYYQRHFRRDYLYTHFVLQSIARFDHILWSSRDGKGYDFRNLHPRHDNLVHARILCNLVTNLREVLRTRIRQLSLCEAHQLGHTLRL